MTTQEKVSFIRSFYPDLPYAAAIEMYEHYQEALSQGYNRTLARARAGIYYTEAEAA